MVGVMKVRAGDIAWEVDEARSYWARFRGLMLRRRPRPGTGLLIEPCSSIHMMFMLTPIDAVFYDRDHRVTRVKRNVWPWVGMAWGGRGALGVIELAPGSAGGVAPGTQLVFERA